MKTYEIDTGSKYFNESEDFLKYLLCENEIVINDGWWDESHPKGKITVYAICNDVFSWGSADAEEVLCSELEELAKMHLKDPMFGTAVWCIKKRKLMPQKPVAERIKNAGYNLEELIK